MTGLDKTALKPCPFCGGGAYMNYSDRGELFGVRCNHWHGNGGSIKCMGAGPYADTEEEAIAGWNRRAALPVTEERVEAAAKAIFDAWAAEQKSITTWDEACRGYIDPQSFSVQSTFETVVLARKEARTALEGALSAASLSRPVEVSQPAEAVAVAFTYTNYKGETATRTIMPSSIWFGSTEWHPEPQWLLRAFDHDRQAYRDFALKDFGYPAPVSAPGVVDDRMHWFLTILDAMGGTSDASEGGWCDAFCEDYEGRDPDTFNRAVDAGYTTTSFNDLFETTTVYLTDKGCAALLSSASGAQGGE